MDSNRIEGHYQAHPETNRLSDAFGKLEFERTKRIVSRYLPASPARILDVGGATGPYSFWLAEMGHRVSLVDLSESQLELARHKQADAGITLEHISVGNVLALEFADSCFDFVLNFGPLYHLPDVGDRQKALAEIKRVLRPGGLLASAYISRFASLMYGYKNGTIGEERFARMAERDVQTGVHDPADAPYFTLAYFHRPEEIAPELGRAGYEVIDVLPIEGMFWNFPHLDQFVEDERLFHQLLVHAETIETEPSILGATSHLLSIARKE